jgi:hypothetical protein
MYQTHQKQLVRPTSRDIVKLASRLSILRKISASVAEREWHTKITMSG